LVYDVIVAGAGPAGAILAHILASRGVRVLLLERAVLPRAKPCGGGLPLKAVHSLPFDASAAFDLPAQGGILAYRGKPLLKATLDPPMGWFVVRERFDHLLAQRAVEAGARLQESTPVSEVEETPEAIVAHTPCGPFTARLLAGADGVNSRVARSLGLLAGRETGLALAADVRVSAKALEAQGGYATFDFGAVPHGYGWIFPKRDHLSIGVFRAAPEVGRSRNGVLLRQHLEAFVRSYPTLHGCTWLALRGHRIPLGGGRTPLHTRRALLVGDAANLADAWLGEGLAYAIRSATIAAEVVLAALESAGQPDLSAYSERIWQGIGRQFGYARRFARLVYRAPRLSSLALSRSPQMQEAVFGALRGDVTLEELYRRILRQAPRIMLQALNG
jgi:geranylgeranyl reductase family protein